MMFPGANASVYTNDYGEPIGWDYPSCDRPDPYEYEDRMDAWWEFLEDASELHEDEGCPDGPCPVCEPVEYREVYEW